MLDNTPTGETRALAALLHALNETGYDFVTPTPATHARVLARPHGPATLRDVFGWSRPFREGSLPPRILTAMRDAGVIEGEGDTCRSTVRASRLDGLLFLHSAYPTVAAESVFFGPDTYRFAHAIAAVVDRPVHRAVDIGSGAGPGAVLIARAHPDAEVFAADINPAALRLAAANAEAAGVPIRPVLSDVLSGVPGEFDLIVANPPYMADPARRAYRDGGGPLGAALSLRILRSAIERLSPGGTLLLYTGAAIVEGRDPFRAEAERCLAGTGHDWRYREADPDVFGEELEHGPYAHADRIAAVVLTVTNSGGRHA